MLLLEIAEFLAVLLLTWLGVDSAVQGALAKGEGLGPEIRTASEIHLAALKGFGMFAAGVFALMIARVISIRRGRGNIGAPSLLPAAAAAAGLGLALQMGFGAPLIRQTWPGPEFAQGFLVAALVGAFVLILPLDPVALLAPLQPVLPVLMVGAFLALNIFGSGTEAAPDTLINLGGFQPLEAVKLAFVVFVAQYFGRRAAKLRYQRDRFFGLTFPRKRLLLPAVLVMVALFAAFLAVKDLGPTLILSLVFLAMFYVVTRSGGWAVTALVLMILMIVAAAHVPVVAHAHKVVLRMQMWLDPWYNAQPFGDQTARARWAIAAGAVTGQGLGQAPATALPAGHTDLVMAHLAEETGFLGFVGYLALLALVAGSGLWIAAFNRTPERMMLATGLSLLLVAQWVVIFSGTTGLLPLTGVVVPYLSYGKTGMLVFILLAAMLARLAENGAARETTQELLEVRRGSLTTLTVTAGLLAAGAVVAFLQGILWGPATSVRGVVTLLASQPDDPNDRVVHLHDPRLQIIADRIPRGEVLDRNGLKIAGTTPDGKRVYPLGDAIGTLLGPPAAVVLRPSWNLERLLEAKLRGYPELPDGPAIWMARRPDGSERLLFVVRSRKTVDDEDDGPPIADPKKAEEARKRAEEDRKRTEEEHKRAQEMAESGETIRLLPLPAPDFRPLLPLMRAPRWVRESRIRQVADDLPSRSVKLSLDARLQTAASQIVRRASVHGKAAAAVVLDVDTGQVLARVQWPDFNPGDPAFLERLQDPNFQTSDPKFLGVYGPWPDKTGVRGLFQGGSAAKIFTALAAARSGLLPSASGSCVPKAGPVFACIHRDADGPFFTKAGWYKPIHDHPQDHTHGQVDLPLGLQVSCNVYFGQLALQLGPEALKKLWADGLEMGWGTKYEPGKPGSRDLALTGFGQGAAMMNVSQAARMVAAVGTGGVYRKCPPSLEKDATCEERRLLPDPGTAAPILSGMARVMAGGTGAGLKPPQGMQVYGKTGTADSIGTEEEKIYGVTKGVYDKPNSWFLALGEWAGQETCRPGTTGRVAVAIVIPRSGKGATYAGPAAMEMLAAAQSLGYPPKPKTPPPGQQASAAAVLGSGNATAVAPARAGAPAAAPPPSTVPATPGSPTAPATPLAPRGR